MDIDTNWIDVDRDLDIHRDNIDVDRDLNAETDNGSYRYRPSSTRAFFKLC